MRYIPNTLFDQVKMLSAIGIRSINELFNDIPSSKRINNIGDVPSSGLSELELKGHADGLSKKNHDSGKYVSFLGGGSYNHFIPSTVKHIVSKPEFYTAYTPYQPEISQGMLQSIFEYQSMICDLTGMDVANASMYDGATALAEAVSLAVHHTGRKEVLVSRALNPNYRSVIKTYGNGTDWKVIEVAFDLSGGATSLEDVKAKLSENTACVVLAQPNFFGCVEDVDIVSTISKNKGALSILSIDPISLGILKKPVESGVDIVTGEGQPLGLSQCFGGPHLGIFAVKKEYIRLMPGRIVGETVDAKGRKGYVLTLQAREQHIRREKAFSNICSNEALCALAATVYLATMGNAGLREVAYQCLQKAYYAKKRFGGLVAFKSPSFMEFAVKLKKPYAQVNKTLLDNSIIGGLDLGKYYPELKDHMLIAVTEMVKRSEIDKLVSLIS